MAIFSRPLVSTEPVPAHQLRRGDVLEVPGLGTAAIAGFRRISDTEMVIKLAWFELCLVSTRDRQWRRVVNEERRTGRAA